MYACCGMNLGVEKGESNFPFKMGLFYNKL